MTVRPEGNGKGRAIFCASFSSLGYHLHEDAATADILTRELYRPGYVSEPNVLVQVDALSGSVRSVPKLI